MTFTKSRKHTLESCTQPPPGFQYTLLSKTFLMKNCFTGMLRGQALGLILTAVDGEEAKAKATVPAVPMKPLPRQPRPRSASRRAWRSSGSATSS